MIKNSLKYTKNYYNLSSKIEEALKYLENNNLKDFANGKYEILGDEIYVNVQDYHTKPLSEGKWEAHRKYIDIQFMIEGEEKIGVGEIQNFQTSEEYDEVRDVEFLTTNASAQFIQMNKNDYLILYPYDVHMPQISVNDSVYVKKAVVKVKV